MNPHALIVGCGAAKLDRAAPARELYTGSLFRAARAYAERSGLPWRILSAEHGLISPDKVIEPYDRHMKTRFPWPHGQKVERRVLVRGIRPDGLMGWVATGETKMTFGDTSWWWLGLFWQLHGWLKAPKHEDWERPDDCVNLPRGAQAVVEVHAGRLYVDAIERAGREHGVTALAPLDGKMLGHRLQWYSRSNEKPANQLDDRAAGQLRLF